VSTALVLAERHPLSQLNTLAAEIREHEQAAREHRQQMLSHVLAIGEHLLTAKVVLPHGEFGPWILREFPHWATKRPNGVLDSRSARQYMAVAAPANRNRVSDLPADTGLSAALLALRDQPRRSAFSVDGPRETLVYAFTACTLSLRCACGQELTGPVALTERGNGELVCTCGRRYVIGCDVRHG
jgi:hypothetical protein